jgi:mRNA (2'-O-methyladenosine-N6-)-methyltransferase
MKKEEDAKEDPKVQKDKMNSKKIDKIFDYSKYYLKTGARPQNFLKENEPHERFKEHPKTQELLKLKDDLIKKRNHPAMTIKGDVR